MLSFLPSRALTTTLAVVAALCAWATTPTAHAAEGLVWAAPAAIDAGEMPLLAVSCPSSALCVAIELDGNVLTSTDPTGGAAAWTATHVDATNLNDDSNVLEDISCPSTSLCVAIDSSGNVLTSTDPTGGTTAWTVTNVAAKDSLGRVSCASITFCAITSGTSAILTSTDPTGGAAEWQTATIAGAEGLTAVACPAISLCVVADEHGNVLTSTDPTSGASTWSAPVEIAGRANGVPEPINGLSCPTTSFCAAVDGYDYDDYEGYSRGDVITSSDPAGGAGAWTAPADIAFGLFRVACPSSSFCLTTDLNGIGYTATSPEAGASAWASSSIDSSHGLNSDTPGLACPSVRLCVAVDVWGNVVVGTPAAEESKEEEKPSGGGGSKESPSTGGTTGGSTSTSLPSSPVVAPIISTPPVAGISSAQLAAMLKQQLIPSGKTAKIGALLKAGGLAMPFKAREAGTLSVQWYELPTGAKLGRDSTAKTVLVAAGKLVFSGAGTGLVRLRLTSVGKRVLKQARRVELAVKRQFAPSGAVAVTSTNTIALRR